MQLNRKNSTNEELDLNEDINDIKTMTIKMFLDKYGFNLDLQNFNLEINSMGHDNPNIFFKATHFQTNEVNALKFVEFEDSNQQQV